MTSRRRRGRAALAAALSLAVVCLGVFTYRQPAVKEHLRVLRWMSLERPALGGPWAVGMAKVTVPGATGAFTVDVLYPADSGALSTDGLRAAFRRLTHPAHAPVIPGARLAARAGGYPLIVYFPSWFSNRSDNTYTLANIASHGFVVAALDDIVHNPPAAGHAREVQVSSIEFSSEEIFARTCALAAERIEMEARTGSEVIDALLGSAAWKASIDSSKVGALGFSFGGGAAAAITRLDPRVRAAMNFDGSLFGETARLGVDRPYLVLFDGDAVHNAEDLVQPDLAARLDAQLDDLEVRRQIRDQDRREHWTFLAPGSEHLDFSDRLVMPAFDDRRGATFDRIAMWREINAAVVTFLNRALLGSPSGPDAHDYRYLVPLPPVPKRTATTQAQATSSSP